MTINCKNCEILLNKDDKYCMQCGQSTQENQRQFVPFMVTSLHELFDVDGRLWLTLRTLLTKPGKASFEYSQGKRVKYTPALRVYIAISVIFFLLFATLHDLPTSTKTVQANLDLYPKAMFVLFPFFAFLSSCFFRKSYYISNLVFSMHIHSITYLLLAIIGSLENAEQKHIIFLVLQAPAAIYFTWYYFSAFKTMYEESWLATLSKSVAIYFLYMSALGFVFDQLL